MKTAICCIAKDEDNYIDEWIEYHFKLGFDDICIYQNNWNYNGKYKDNPRIILKFFPDKQFNIIQMHKYHEFIKQYWKTYDWVAFIDIDQFIVLKQDNNISSFLEKYNDYKAVGLNWNLFSSKETKNEINDNPYSYINRFFYCAKKLNFHIKVIVHTSLTKDQVGFCGNPHNIQNNSTISVDKTHYINGPFNHVNLQDKSIAVLNHYFYKTKVQFQKKAIRNRHPADQFNGKPGWMMNVSEEYDDYAFKFFNEK